MSDENTPGHTAGLGDRLLGLIPPPRSRQDSTHDSKPNRLGALAGLLAEGSLGRLTFIAVLAALCGTGVLFLLNAEAREIDEQSYSVLLAVLFAILLVIYRFSQDRLIRSASSAIEIALDQKRQRVVADVLQLSLQDIEQIGLARLRDGIAANYGSLSQTLVPIIAGVEALILLVFMFAYVLSLSIFAGVLALVVVGLTVGGYLGRQKQMDAEMASAAAADEQFRALTDAIANGAKELQLSLRRRAGLEDAMRASSALLAKARSGTAAHFADLIATGTTISYLMAGAVVFVMPLISGRGEEDISRIVVAVIFLLGPIGSVVQTVQQFATAQHALNAITGFEAQVASLRTGSSGLSPDGQSPQDDGAIASAFDRIAMVGVGYAHGKGDGFAIANVDLTLNRGEIVFLTGGNGSGKTTLLRVLTGLYPRRSGELSLNEETVPVMPPQAYRELFAGVFADFHLFDRPFGLDVTGMAVFADWLERFGIRDKLGPDLTELHGDQLSTGQRKRVALALALAEQRPILVLDEWAADQDPETRALFYREILPGLRAEGRTVFAITHDEQYFDCCDRRLHMVEGRLVPGGLD